jgi:orotate phosphoribosyltransferase
MPSTSSAARPSALVEHLRRHALRTDGPFTLRSGAQTSWYLDARQTTFDGAGALAVGAAVLEHLDAEVDAVGGMTMGADSIAVATAATAASRGRPLRAFSIRKAAKQHGVGGRLVGPVSANDRVAVVEDTTTTGGALEEALDVLAAAGIDVVQVVVLVDRSGPAVTATMAHRGLAYTVLVRPADLGVPSDPRVEEAGS